ncbi:DUF3015 domain-containing protein [Nitrospiraceae bacterium AH_259_D15_M11_P09]|nr:DUF3015 domain-containing protein [Nitrospiraceae bacterium AH_259_D15_M11_P09]
MLKKLLIVQLVLVVIGFQAVGVLAKPNRDTGPGCGMGKMAWAEYKKQKNIAPQMMMASTNALFSNWLAIATGTSGCTNDGIIMAEHKVNVFAATNFENVSQDMARGQGEHLASLATLMGVPEDQQAEFFTLAQDKYTTLIQSGETTPVAMLKALNDAMETHPVLAQLSTAR